MFRATVFAAAVLLAVVACTQSVGIALQADVPAKVYVLGTQAERTLLPGSAGHKQLSQWVEANQSGWKPYLATRLRSESLSEQRRWTYSSWSARYCFIPHGGAFSKSVQPSEYSFLFGQTRS